MFRAAAKARHCAALRFAMMTALALSLAACATSKLPKLAVCDGKHRRDANPYGTVLPGAPIPAPVGPLGGKHPALLPPPPPPPADKTSALVRVPFYASC